MGIKTSGKRPGYRETLVAHTAPLDTAASRSVGPVGANREIRTSPENQNYAHVLRESAGVISEQVFIDALRKREQPYSIFVDNATGDFQTQTA